MAEPLRVVCRTCKTVCRVPAGTPPGAGLLCPRCGRATTLPGQAGLPDSPDGDSAAPASIPSDTPTMPSREGGSGDGAALPTAEAQGAPGRYVQRGLIGRGGMGEVVLCVDRDIRRAVAMKRMLPATAADPARRARFVEEAQVTGQLEHPNIVPVYELTRQADGTVYYTMKHVKGRSLADILGELRAACRVPRAQEEAESGLGSEDAARGTRDVASHASRVTGQQPPPSLGDLLQIFLKVCDGVAFAHSRGVIHRDLKPANIMVGDYGEVLVMDWGLAKIVSPVGRRPEAAGGEDESRPASPVPRAEEDDYPPEGIGTFGREQVASDRQEAHGLHTLEGSTLGTPAYMSPEQAKGELDKLDARSDIWSLGAILYEILALERAVEGETSYAVLANTLRGSIVAPEQRAPKRDVPRELSAIAMKCLHKSRARRYHSVRELRGDITLFLEGRSVSAAPDTFGQALVKLVKRNKGVSAAAGAAVVILMAVVAVFMVRLRGERDQARASESRAVASERKAVAAQTQQRATALEASEALARQAIRAAEEGRSAEADVRADAALKVLPDGPWGPYALALVARQRRDLATARTRLEEALRLDPAHLPSKAALSELRAAEDGAAAATGLLRRLDEASDWRTLLSAGEALFAAGAYPDAVRALERAIALMEGDAKTPKMLLFQKRYRLLAARAEVACAGFYESIRELPVEEQQRRITAKFAEINGPEAKPRFKVENGTIAGVDVSGYWMELRSLRPLKGMPLTWLNCRNTGVMDLTPLKGMPLTTLNCYQTPVDDLGPLKAMPLTSLDCCLTGVEDLAPLEGMPLTYLDCTRTKVRSLGPLAGMPLTTLICAGTGVTDLRPLKGMPLNYLDCSYTQLEDLRPLAGMRLTNLLLSNTPVSDLRPLQGMPLTRLVLDQTIAADITPLKGMLLTELSCSLSSVRDLSPLHGMPLVRLWCHGSEVKDLSPLKGMQLEVLNCASLGVTDLRPLEGMPLMLLQFDWHRIKHGIEIVRRMETIRTIGTWDKTWKPDEFWKKYDAGELPK